MSRRWFIGLASGGLAATILLASLTVALFVRTHSTPVEADGPPRFFDLVLGIAAPLYAAVGALIVSRRQGNRVGWIFWTLGLLLAATMLAQEFAVYALLERATPLRGGATAAWFTSWSTFTAMTFFAYLLLLFPNGALLSRRWRIAAWGTGLGLVLFVVGTAVEPGHFESPYSSFQNPYGIESARVALNVLLVAGWLLSSAGLVAAAVSLAIRLRRSRGDERQQIKWLAYTMILLVVALSAADFLYGESDAGVAAAAVAAVAAVVAIPVSAAIAIFRYRLYDIDVVINRTLVYGSLTAILAGAYLGIVLLLQLAFSPVTQGSDLAIAGSTLAVAALFRPARRRIQAAVDRRFYRRRYDAERTLEAFSSRLREEVDLDALSSELRALVHETMQPAHVSLWLRGAGR